jgi:hypothetical protein
MPRPGRREDCAGRPRPAKSRAASHRRSGLAHSGRSNETVGSHHEKCREDALETTSGLAASVRPPLSRRTGICNSAGERHAPSPPRSAIAGAHLDLSHLSEAHAHRNNRDRRWKGADQARLCDMRNPGNTKRVCRLARRIQRWQPFGQDKPADQGPTPGEIMASWKVARGPAHNISGTGGTIVRPLDSGSACARLICCRRARVVIEQDEARRLAPSNEQRCDVRRA